MFRSWCGVFADLVQVLRLKPITVVVSLSVLMSMVACNRGEVTMNQQNSNLSLAPIQLEAVRSLRVYFGHQSVGDNILHGLYQLADEDNAYRLNIVHSENPEEISGPVFAHFRVGKNMTPESKISSFRQHMEQSASAIDLAFFKFCYLDVDAKTDVATLFATYQQLFNELKIDFPQVIFMHTTVPLKAVDGGFKGLVKKLLGKSNGEEANLGRSRFNQLLRTAYQGKEPIFDLAALESTAPNGSKVGGQKNGCAFEALYAPYSDDGEHLNACGSRYVALALWQTLATTANSQ